MTAGRLQGTMTQGYSTDATIIMRGTNGQGEGSGSMTVLGSGLGSSRSTGMARTGQTGCEVSQWESETAVRCMVSGACTAASLRVVMTTGMQAGSGTMMYSQDVQVLLRGSGNGAGTGGTVWRVHGGGLGGSHGSSVQARAGQSGCERTDWTSGTSVRCMMGQGGQGPLRATMTVGGQVGSMTGMVSVDMPTVIGMDEVNGRGKRSLSVTLSGSSMGLAGVSLSSRLVETGC